MEIKIDGKKYTGLKGWLIGLPTLIMVGAMFMFIAMIFLAPLILLLVLVRLI